MEGGREETLIRRHRHRCRLSDRAFRFRPLAFGPFRRGEASPWTYYVAERGFTTYEMRQTWEGWRGGGKGHGGLISVLRIRMVFGLDNARCAAY